MACVVLCAVGGVGLFIFREHDATPDLIPMLDLAHSVFNAVTGATVQEERTEIRAFRPIQQWRDILTAAGFTDTYLYEMEEGDPTVDEMHCFCKGALHDFIPRLPNEVVRTVPVGRMPQPADVLPASAVEQCEGMLEQMPTFIVDAFRVTAVKLTEVVASLRGTLEARFGTGIKQASLFNKLDLVTKPLLMVLRQVQPYLDGKQLTQKYRGVMPVPLEIWLLLTLVLERAEDGSAAPEELLVADVVKKLQSFLAPSPGQSDATAAGNTNLDGDTERSSAEATPDAVGSGEITAVVLRFLEADPGMTDVEAVLDGSGFSASAQNIIRQKIPAVPAGRADPEHLARRIGLSLAPWLDREAWEGMVPQLEAIIAAPAAHRFSKQNITTPNHPWHLLFLALLGSRHVKPARSVQFTAGIVGLGDFIAMWKTAQRSRAAEKQRAALGGQAGSSAEATEVPTTRLEPNAQQLVTRALEQVHAHTGRPGPAGPGALAESLAMLDKVLAAVNIVGPVDPDGVAEFTWYKLPEWLQVEFVQEFGTFMQQAPWFRFPFMDMLATYFSVLSQEFSLVERKHGLARASASMGFLVSLVPGIVMGGVFSALSAIAVPCNMAFGSEYDGFAYTPEAVAKQVQHLVVTSRHAYGRLGWNAVHPRITGELVVPGVYILHVPAFEPFTDVIMALAHVPADRGLHIVYVQNAPPPPPPPHHHCPTAANPNTATAPMCQMGVSFTMLVLPFACLASSLCVAERPRRYCTALCHLGWQAGGGPERNPSPRQRTTRRNAASNSNPAALQRRV